MQWYWKLYLGLLLLAGYGQMLRKILTDTGGFSSRYSAAIVATVLVVALIAQARDLPLLKPWLWKALSVLLGMVCIAGLLFSVYLGYLGVYYAGGLLFLAVILLVPATQQIYRYAFRSPQLWNTTGDTDNLIT